MKKFNNFGKKHILTVFTLLIVLIITTFSGCGGGGGGGGTSPEASSPTTTATEQTGVTSVKNLPITYQVAVKEDQETNIDVGSIRLQLPVNAFTENTNIIIVEDKDLTTLGSFISGFTPQSSLFTIKIETPVESFKSLRQSAVIESTGVWLDGIATLSIRLSNQYDSSADYLVACRDTSNNWYFLPWEGRTTNGFYVKISNIFRDYMLVRRDNSTASMFIGNGISVNVQPTNSLIASYTTQKFEENLEVSIKFALNPYIASTFDENKLSLQLYAYKGCTTKFLYTEDDEEKIGTVPLRQAGNGTVFTSDKKKICFFSTKTTSVENGRSYTSYTAKMKFNDELKEDYPDMIVLKASYPGETNGTTYSAEQIVYLSMGAEPPTNPYIAESEPASGSIVLVPEKIKITFSHKMLESSLENAITLSDGTRTLGFTQSLDEEQKILKIIPNSEFEAEKTYTVTIATMAQSLEEEGGLNPLEPLTLTFKTVTSSGVTTVPVNREENVATSTLITFTFNQIVSNKNAVEFSLYRISEVENPAAILANSVAASITQPVTWNDVASHSEAIIDPEEYFDYYTKYKATVSGAKYTVEGTDFSIADTSVTFTTDIQPELIAREPKGAGILETTPFSLTFNKTIATSTFHFYVNNKTNNTILELTEENSVFTKDNRCHYQSDRRCYPRYHPPCF